METIIQSEPPEEWTDTPILPMRHGNPYKEQLESHQVDYHSDPTYEAWKQNRRHYFQNQR